ncbi:MAG: HipA family kinase [Jatrophihabitans sp.]|uniref:HipA family kinase n=1 Tax=Jatrophihabitans sp. TaxID=1932789 RepID=UPI003F7E3089
MLDPVVATRYVTPLREGGSLPGLMEADDDGMYVVKFTGAGQGPPALVAEVISGSLAASLGLPTPRLVTIDVDPALSSNEPDEEVQDLLRTSPGLNLGVDFLPGALDLDIAAFPIDPGTAGRILWFDALVNNVDRSWRNPNLLVWHGEAYLIDHGATLTFQHTWPRALATADRAYDVREHVLLGCAPRLDEDDLPALSAEQVDDALAQVPDEWLEARNDASADEIRDRFAAWFGARLAARPVWEEALRVDVAAGPPPRPERGHPPGWRP